MPASLFELNAFVYRSRPIILVLVFCTTALLTNGIGSSTVQVTYFDSTLEFKSFTNFFLSEREEILQPKFLYEHIISQGGILFTSKFLNKNNLFMNDSNENY